MMTIMDQSVIAELAAVASVLAATFFFPKWFSFRQRAIAGAILFPLGSLGIFIGLALGDQPIMRSETFASIWIGACGFALILSITLLVPVLFEWRRKTRHPRARKEKWPAGHWKG